MGGGASNSSHNIGDIFYTTRTDNSLNGAVECNGSQYNFSDFDSNLQSLFDDGKLPYIPISEFDSMVTNQGGCDSFGYGTTDEIVLYPVYIYTVMDIGIQFYTNVLNWHDAQKDSNDVLQGVKLYDKNTYQELVGWYVKYDSLVGLYYIYNSEDEEQDGDGNGYMPESSDTVTVPTGGEIQPTSYFKVPKKLSRVLVRTQKPTADNNYTWYNVYADGWVEQGGRYKDKPAAISINLPITMNDGYYFISVTSGTVVGNAGAYASGFYSASTTTIGIAGITNNNNNSGKWEVKGYADPAEYTKDKWNYQNIQVERCMVQLFNSTTDTAVATCNQVLADVSALNQGDYVIETQIPTPENNYTWYRLYKSGWVEQGGYVSYTGSWTEVHIDSVELPIEFANTDYRIIIGRTQPADGDVLSSYDVNKTTTGFSISSYAVNQSSAVASNWFAVGMSAQRNN